MILSGPAGHLEHRLDPATNPRRILAILSHPHPQYGGSLNDAVLTTACQALKKHQITTLRFNFRGVGASEGRFDGIEEAEDLLAVSQSCAELFADDDIWWIGYSFGAAMTLRALASEQPARTLLIAPPNKVMQIPLPDRDLAGDIHAIAGDGDSYVDADGLHQNAGIQTTLIAGADHFFSGQHSQLEEAISQWVKASEQT